MELKKLDKRQFEIITDNYIIYLCKEKNPNTEYYLYFVDVFEINSTFSVNDRDEIYDSEVFDDMSLAIDYINDNYIISEGIYNKLKDNNNG